VKEKRSGQVTGDGRRGMERTKDLTEWGNLSGLGNEANYARVQYIVCVVTAKDLTNSYHLSGLGYVYQT
jgi:hypothetical protein